MMVAGDFNGDCHTDIAMTGGSTWNSIPIAFASDDGNFTETNYRDPAFPGGPGGIPFPGAGPRHGCSPVAQL
jgi:hypothetical protein